MSTSKLDNITLRIKDTDSYSYEGRLTTEAKQQIKDLFLELVGEDEPRPESGPQRNGTAQAIRRAANKAKADMRQRIAEL